MNKVHKKQENEAPVLREMLALDPTTPWFEDQPLLEDLDKNKARYVEVSFISKRSHLPSITYSMNIWCIFLAYFHCNSRLTPPQRNLC